MTAELECCCPECGAEFTAQPEGGHRLLCGDARSLPNIERLVEGTVPDLAHCDPPYGISVVKGSRIGGDKPFGKIGGGGVAKAGLYAPIIGDDSTNTALESYAVLLALQVPVIVLWGGNYFANQLPPSRCWLVWDKENYGHFADAELAWTNQDVSVRLLRHQWSGMIRASERGEKRVHPTQKPVVLAEWVFKTIAPDAKSVIDLFLGSGSSLIACEITGRRCFGAEMAPAYCDVAIKRWSRFTGRTAVLAHDGRTFDEPATARGNAA